MKYLLDTCVVSDFMKKESGTIRHFEHVNPSDLTLSTLTVMEVEFGLALNPERGKKLRPLWEKLLTLIKILPFTEKDAVNAAIIRKELTQTGQLIGPYDFLIAAVALSHKLTLVTSNTKEFKRVTSLPLQNWRTERRDER